MRPVIWPKPGRRALLTGLGALAAGGLLTRRQARAVTISSSGGQQPPFRRNLLRRNGGFEVWQRGAGGAAVISAPSGNVYTADGWYMNVPASQASTVTQVAGLVDGSQWACKVQRNAGQTGVAAMTFGFPLDTDELYPLLGQWVSMSYTAVAGANWSPASGNLAIRLAYGTGTPIKQAAGYTNFGQLMKTQPLSGVATRFTFTGLSIVPVNTRQAEVNFIWTPVGTAGADDSFTVDTVKLEVVPDAFGQATEYERYTFEEELLLCQTHFCKTFNYNVAPQSTAGDLGAVHGGTFVAAASAKAVAGEWRFPVNMRVNPVITTWNYGAAGIEVRNQANTTDCTGTTVSGIGKSGAYIAATGNAGGLVGDRWALHLSADAGI